MNTTSLVRMDATEIADRALVLSSLLSSEAFQPIGTDVVSVCFDNATREGARAKVHLMYESTLLTLAERLGEPVEYSGICLGIDRREASLTFAGTKFFAFVRA